MDEAILGLTARIVTGYVGNNSVPPDKVPALIRTVHQALSTADAAPAAAVKIDPAVEVRKSVFRDHLVCLACGASFKTLKRHLGSEHQLTPAAYRERFGLPHGYPFVAPDYAKVRSAMAKKIGLGQFRRRGRNVRGKRG